MTFKAKIISCTDLSTLSRPAEVGIPFHFTKRNILFSKRHTQKRYYLSIPLACPFQHETQYTFDKVHDKEDKRRFIIYLNSDKNCGSYLQLTIWNKIKCNIIHHRYFIDREKEWFWKTLIAAAIGFVFGVIGSSIGYRKGYQNGLREGKSQSQDTTLKR